MGSLDSEPAALFASPAASPGSAEKTQKRSSPGKKQRPAELHLDHANDHVAPSQAPPTRKESRMGLRNLFGRSKAAVKEDPANLGNLASPTTAARFAGIQPSVTDMGTRPYAKAAANLDAVLSMELATEPSLLPQEAHERNGNPLGPSKPNGATRRKTSASKVTKSSSKTTSAVDAPPLFKAFPLSIRYATLPAMTAQAESVLRMYEKRDAYAAVFEAFEQGDERAKAKKKHTRHPSESCPKLEWTQKIYVLANSGCVLQYATEGPLDRLPEKVLRLNRDSAAFASDMIPGKHWVLQITNNPEGETPSAAESRSLFSRIAFRHVDKREVTQLLVVFESAEDMGSWMTTLRAEIERLAKNTSDTGDLNKDQAVSSLRARPSQQTLVVRESQRYSGGSSQAPSYDSSDRPMSEGSITVTDTDTFTDITTDDASMTNSTLSHEGQQLESLRDSAHRFSYLSVGQRTAVTSTGSSPVGSPTLGHFPKSDPLEPNAHLRPSGAEAVDKRSSCQTPTAMEDGNDASENHRSAVTSPSDSRPSSVMSSQTPNFSVPSSSSRRYSRLPPSDPENLPTLVPSPEREPNRSGSPSTSLRSTRPLSLVMDEPSSHESTPERPTTSHLESRRAFPISTVPVTRVPAEQFRRQSTNVRDVQKRRQSFMPLSFPASASLAPRPQPRRLSSMNSIREHDATSPVLLEQGYTSIAPKDGQAALDFRSRTNTPERERPSSVSSYSKRTFSPAGTRRSKRLSIHSILPDGSIFETEVASMNDLPPPAVPPPSIALPPLPPVTPSATRHSQFIPQHSHSQPALAPSLSLKPSPARGLLNRRSMPHLAADGPPPAPPPTCALPPIPQHLARRTMQSTT